MPSLSVKHNDKREVSGKTESTDAKYKQRVLFLISFTSFNYSIKSELKNSTHSRSEHTHTESNSLGAYTELEMCGLFDSNPYVQQKENSN